MGWDTWRKSETSFQRRFHPAFLKLLVSSNLIHHLKCSRGRHEPRGSECRRLNCGRSIKELASELDVSFASLTCGRAREVMELAPEVSLLANAWKHLRHTRDEEGPAILSCCKLLSPSVCFMTWAKGFDCTAQSAPDIKLCNDIIEGLGGFDEESGVVGQAEQSDEAAATSESAPKTPLVKSP